MLVVIPPFFIDIFIAISISLSVFLFFMAIYIKRPLDFSVLPFFLLLVTLFRLSLNVASTRLILLHGAENGSHAAGEIINNFGKFVIGNNYLVGLIIFLILAIINIVVITKGAGRVAEVAARFNLDALTGKQLSIDTDLNAGLITEEEAKQRRQELTQESDFYGAMDGASKFIRGDAFVGLLIVLVNIMGGLAIGILQSSMSFFDTVQNFVLLTIGDGLVSQIPALIVSAATGIIITRTNSQKTSLSEQMNSQVISHSHVLVGVSVLMIFLAAIPSLPATPFLLIAIVTAGAFYFLSKKDGQVQVEEVLENKKDELENVDELSEKPTVNDLLSVDVLCLELGYNLMYMLNGERKKQFLHSIEKNRREFATKMGVLLPTLNIKDNTDLDRNEYRLLLNGATVGSFLLSSNNALVCNLSQKEKILYQTKIIDNFPELNGVWIEKNTEISGADSYTLSDQFSIIDRHIKLILNDYLYELLGREELKTLLDNFEKHHPKLVHDVLQEPNSFSIILKVLRNLLMESVPIKDMKTILEVIADEIIINKDAVHLTECVRRRLHRFICSSLLNNRNELSVVTLDSDIEASIFDILNENESHGMQINDNRDFLIRLAASLSINFHDVKSDDCRSIILCSPKIRYHLKRMLSPYKSGLVVLSHFEVDPSINVKSMGTVRLPNNAG